MSEAEKINKNSAVSGIKCCVRSCQKSRRQNLNLKMFKFPPADHVFGKIWREKCNIKEQDDDKQLYICENHFCNTFVGKKKLKSDAVPTLNLEDQEVDDEELLEPDLPKKARYENDCSTIIQYSLRRVDCQRERNHENDNNVRTIVGSQPKWISIGSSTDVTANNKKDPDLLKLITQWNLQQHYDYFVEQKISIKVLKILQKHHVDKLFAQLPVGEQAIFEHRLDIWKKTLLFDEDFSNKRAAGDASASAFAATTKRQKLASQDNGNESVPTNTLMEEFESNDSIDSQVVATNDATPQTFYISTPAPAPKPVVSTPRSVPATAAPVIGRHAHVTSVTGGTKAPPAVAREPLPIVPAPYGSRHSMPCRYDLMKILNETSGGQLILSYYNKHQHLREEHRTALINVIARYIDANGCTLALSESNQLEAQIVEMFPTEKAEFYRTARRGRIYNKIANMKRVYNKFNKDAEEPVIPTQVPSPSSSSISIKEEDEYGDVYTEHNIDDWRAKAHNTGNFQEFWKGSQSLRLKQINEIETLQEILTRWPEYKEGNIAEWVALDYAAKFPKATKFSQIFHDSLPKLERLLFTKVSTSSSAFKYLQLYQKCSSESQHLIVLYALHQLFPPKHHTVVENGVKCKKRHSIQDSQNSCIYIQSTQIQIDNFLSTKTTATPPMLLVVGELGGEIEEVSVYFEGVCYPMTSVVQAAELCCELFFLFNIDFPEESVLLYHFVQTFFLNIPPETKNSRIYTTINDINAY